ncbi:MAG: LysM peptidoglycan-binding domain-containing protein [Chloroflexota bacterium]
MFSRRNWTIVFAFSVLTILGGGLAACERSAPFEVYITPDSIWSTGQASTNAGTVKTPTNSYILPSTRVPGSAILTPTPDSLHYKLSTERGPETYVVQSGDILSAIARRYGISMDALAQANNIVDVNALEVGQVLTIPAPEPRDPGPSFKLIPDSELVYGPLSGQFDVERFVQDQQGYLAGYTDVVNGEVLTGSQVIQMVAQNFSVNPRILLAVLEYRSSWVTNPNPDSALADTPLDFSDGYYLGLYKQLVLAACHLNDGYYRWRSDTVTNWVLSDGSVVPIDPTINAGTAGVQNLFAQLDDYATWIRDVSPVGFDDTYGRLFGYPFDLAIEPLVPSILIQPALLLPFGLGEVWAFTGGPHLVWDFGSPLGALDFAPPGEAQGCVEANVWVTAMAGGLVLRTGDGMVLEDLDGDGNEGTGWVILYMHVETRDRVQPGEVLAAGDRVGHPSCEGGVSTGTHVHVARRFNGEWVSAIGPVPFNLSGWISSGTGEEYVGTLTLIGVVVESFEGNSAINQIQR